MVCSTSGMPPSPLQIDALIHSRAVQGVSSPRMSSRPCSHSLYSITTSNFRTMSRVGRRMCALGPTSFLLPTRKYYFANGTQRRSVPTCDVLLYIHEESFVGVQALTPTSSCLPMHAHKASLSRISPRLMYARLSRSLIPRTRSQVLQSFPPD